MLSRLLQLWQTLVNSTILAHHKHLGCVFLKLPQFAFKDLEIELIYMLWVKYKNVWMKRNHWFSWYDKASRDTGQFNADLFHRTSTSSPLRNPERLSDWLELRSCSQKWRFSSCLSVLWRRIFLYKSKASKALIPLGHIGDLSELSCSYLSLSFWDSKG